MAWPSQQDIVVALLARHGTTYAREAGIALGRAGPAALWRLLCLSLLLSARISADLAVAAARALAALRACSRLGLPDDSRRLAKLAGGPAETARLAAALVRVELAGDHDEVRAAAGGS